jgi:hypothetical protein
MSTFEAESSDLSIVKNDFNARQEARLQRIEELVSQEVVVGLLKEAIDCLNKLIQSIPPVDKPEVILDESIPTEEVKMIAIK